MSERLSRRAVLAGAAAAAVIGSARGARAASEGGRIVSLGGDVTETVFLLGAGSRVVGRDTTSYYPDAANALPDVGYLRQLGAEGVLSLKPDIVIAAHDAGPPVVLEQIAGAGVHVETLAPGYGVETVAGRIARIGEVIGRKAEGHEQAVALMQRMTTIESRIAKRADRPRALFLLNAADGAPMAAGRETAADAIIALLGAQNVFAAHSGYKPISLESSASAAPEVILLMEHSVAAMGGIEKIRAHPVLKLTPAAREGRIVARDGLYLLGFGPRLPDAVAEIAAILHPGLTL